MLFKKALLAATIALVMAAATACQSTGDVRSVPTNTGGGTSY